MGTLVATVVYVGVFYLLYLFEVLSFETVFWISTFFIVADLISFKIKTENEIIILKKHIKKILYPND